MDKDKLIKLLRLAYENPSQDEAQAAVGRALKIVEAEKPTPRRARPHAWSRAELAYCTQQPIAWTQVFAAGQTFEKYIASCGTSRATIRHNMNTPWYVEVRRGDRCFRFSFDSKFVAQLWAQAQLRALGQSTQTG